MCRQPTIAAFLIIMEAHRGVHKLLLHVPGPKLKRPPVPDLHVRGGVTCLDLPNNNLIRWHQEKSAGRDRGGAEPWAAEPGTNTFTSNLITYQLQLHHTSTEKYLQCSTIICYCNREIFNSSNVLKKIKKNYYYKRIKFWDLLSILHQTRMNFNVLKWTDLKKSSEVTS